MTRALTWPIAALGIAALALTGWALIVAAPWPILIAAVAFTAAGWVHHG